MSGESDQYVRDIVDLHLSVHQQLREAIVGLDERALNWTPAVDTSSIGTIVRHALGSEAEMLRNVLGMATTRDRDGEFAPRSYELRDLISLLDAADEDWRELGSRLGDDALATLRPRPNRPEIQSGLFWLVRNYGHLREHAAQIALTRQLYEAQQR